MGSERTAIGGEGIGGIGGTEGDRDLVEEREEEEAGLCNEGLEI